MSERIGVLGAGSWGTTLADLLAKKGHEVRLWSYESDVAGSINEARENRAYLAGFRLDSRLEAVTEIATAVSEADVVVSVTPAQHVRGVLEEAGRSMRRDALIVSASKGIEIENLQTMADVIVATLPRSVAVPAVFLSGPSFAREVVAGRPTAVSVASRVESAARRAQSLFQTERFRVYTTRDVVGVELGGALKNVIALAAGMATGLELGHNARAALITRGLAEIQRLGESLGADPLTFAGLAGMGDLILTCTGELSRNLTVGMALGRGRRLDEVLGEMRMVAEGVPTTRAAKALAEREGVEMPIVAEVHAVLFEGHSPKEAVENLMLREPKAEQWR